jgi:hypothetical protein
MVLADKSLRAEAPGASIVFQPSTWPLSQWGPVPCSRFADAGDCGAVRIAGDLARIVATWLHLPELHSLGFAHLDRRSEMSTMHWWLRAHVVERVILSIGWRARV